MSDRVRHMVCGMQSDLRCVSASSMLLQELCRELRDSSQSYRIIIDFPDCILSLFLLELCHYQGIFALILKGWVEDDKNRKSSW